MRRIKQRALLIAAVIFLVFVAVGIVLWLGGHDVLAGRLSAGQLSAFVFYAVIVATSIGAVSEVAGELQRAAGATERLLELLDTVPEIAPPVDPVPLPDPPRATVAPNAEHVRARTRDRRHPRRRSRGRSPCRDIHPREVSRWPVMPPSRSIG